MLKKTVLFSEPNAELQNPNHDRMPFPGGNKNFRQGSSGPQAGGGGQGQGQGPGGGGGNRNFHQGGSSAPNGAPASNMNKYSNNRGGTGQQQQPPYSSAGGQPKVR